MLRERANIRSAFGALLVVALAVACRRFAYTTPNAVLEKLAQFLRFFLYAGFISLWGISVQRRVVQSQVRRFMTLAAALMLLFLTFRELRWHLVRQADAQRLLWYGYYLFLLGIPLLILFVALSAGRPEDWSLPRRALIPALPTLALMMLVLTNDLHHGAFVFLGPCEAQYRYGPVYYLAVLWALLCGAAAFAVLLSRCRLPRAGGFLYLPLVPFALMLVYILLYARSLPPVEPWLDDLTVTACLLFTAFFECCIQSGLILSNTRYAELFAASVDSSALITDREGHLRYAAEGAALPDAGTLRKSEQSPLLLRGGQRLSSMPIRGGRVYWTEDLSELLEQNTRLKEVREELSERNEILRLEYAQGREETAIREQNRLYDLMQESTQTQLDRVRELAAAYRRTDLAPEKRRLLARIIVLGSYIKRRRDFVLSLERSGTLPENVLKSALQESLASLSLLGIRGVCFVHTGREQPSGALLARAYDFFEDVIEALPEGARFVNVRVTELPGGLTCSVESDAGADAARLCAKYPCMDFEPDEDGGGICRLPLLEEGGVKA